MTTNNAIKKINKHRKKYYNSPKTFYQKRSKFDYLSYNKWALDEIYLTLRRNTGRNAIKVIEDFRYSMDLAATNAKTDSCNFMFSIAYDAATDILDILLTED